MEIFDLVLGQVQKGCFLVVVASALTSISSMSKHRLLRTVWDQSSSDPRRTSAYAKLRFRQQILIFNSDFRKRTSVFQNILPFSNFHFRKQTPLLKLPFFKANFDFPIQFFENKLRVSIKQTPSFQAKLKCPFKLPYIYPSRRDKRVMTSIHRVVSAYWYG